MKRLVEGFKRAFNDEEAFNIEGGGIFQDNLDLATALIEILKSGEFDLDTPFMEVNKSELIFIDHKQFLIRVWNNIQTYPTGVEVKISRKGTLGTQTIVLTGASKNLILDAFKKYVHNKHSKSIVEEFLESFKRGYHGTRETI